MTGQFEAVNFTGCVLSLKPLEKPGKPKCFFQAWKSLENAQKILEKPGKLKLCKSVIVGIFGTSISYVKIFFRTSGATYIIVTLSFIGAARKMAQFSHTYSYTYS